jgi:amidase
MGRIAAGASAGPPDDPFGAFCRDNHVALAGSGRGPLAGLVFAAKDVFHVAGHRTGFGHPDWLRTHGPAGETAAAIRLLLDAGADMAGKTLTDELAYSLTGENVHYGTPVNPRCPERVPGGSSNGSVAAVAGGLVDFALGTDCGGSVRLPASYCGVLGMRPTHGRVPLDGAIPFAPSFDAAGWFARDADVFERVGRVLLADDERPAPPRRLLVANDAFGLVDRKVADALADAVAWATEAVGRTEDVVVSREGLEAWAETFRVLQAAEIWANHGAWTREVRPRFGPGIKERMEWASAVDAGRVAAAGRERRAVLSRLDELIGDGDVLCLPTSPRIAPLKNTSTHQVEVVYRQQAMCLLCVAGLGGLPQVSLPLASLDGCPLGLSLVAKRGADALLLALAKILVGEAAARA